MAVTIRQIPILLLLGLKVLYVALILVIRALSVYCFKQLGRRRLRVEPSAITIGFFHPYCNAGGGGERVLWLAIKALAGLHSSGTPLHVVIYSGDKDVTRQEILRQAKAHFGVDLEESKMPISFIFVPGRSLLEAWRYPVFTMVGQSLGSVVLAGLCLWYFVPDVFIDTTGCAFTYPLARLNAGCRVVCYTHYPTISTDMLNMVREQRPSYNNDGAVAGSTWRTTAKLLYYHVFAWCYGLCGAFVDLPMVNSTWTRNHIKALWKLQPVIHTVFPPCDTRSLQALPLGKREPIILSVGQFRPEKDHPLQIRAFSKLLKSGGFKHVKLVLLGSCRGPEDEARVERLRKLVQEEGVQAQVEFVVNAKFSELKEWLQRASVGLHTMWNEHFGICVVEYMAAGLVPVAHNTGGPRMDIIVPYKTSPTGFLASTAEEYAQVLSQLFTSEGKSEDLFQSIPPKARASVQRFSDEAFSETFSGLMLTFLNKQFFGKST